MTESSKALFLSYASEDSDAALRICMALRAAGIEVWFDQSELRGGDAWDQKIRRQIKSCALFMPLISARTRVRTEGYFRLEWKLAVDRSHLIATDHAFLVPRSADRCTLQADAAGSGARELLFLQRQLGRFLQAGRQR
jgi:TIR domain